jgi:hypothetical protein
MDIAATYAVLGDKHAALHWSQRAYESGWREYRALARDPVFEIIAGSQPFQALLARMQTDVTAMRQRATIEQRLPIVTRAPLRNPAESR